MAGPPGFPSKPPLHVHRQSQSQTFRPTNNAHESFGSSPSDPMPPNLAPAPGATRPIPIGTPASVSVLVRFLPQDSNEDSLRMFTLSNDYISHEFTPSTPNDHGLPDPGFCSALVKFRTTEAALEFKNKLNGFPNATRDANMQVEILTTSPTGSSNYTVNPSPTSPSATTSPAATTNSTMSNPGSGPRIMAAAAFAPRPSQRDHSFSTSNSQDYSYSGMLRGAPHDFPGPTSPIGGRSYDPPRVSGKSLIVNTLNQTDDDETADLLNNPLAFAEAGPASAGPHGRRFTEPGLITAMENLNFNSSTTPASTSVPYGNGNPLSPHTNGTTPMGGPGSGYPHPRSHFPAINPADQNPPCNTLYVGNLPQDTSEEELKALFSRQRGYKRLCFRAKHNGPMCFVEFEDVSFATKALTELYGTPLHNSTKGGVRLSFSKNPLGVRSQHSNGANHHGGMNGMHNGVNGHANGFGYASAAPPPGLATPPGLGQGRGNHGGAPGGGHQAFQQNGYGSGPQSAWSRPAHNSFSPANGFNPNTSQSRFNASNGFDGQGLSNGNGVHGGPNGTNGVDGPATSSLNGWNGHAPYVNGTPNRRSPHFNGNQNGAINGNNGNMNGTNNDGNSHGSNGSYNRSNHGGGGYPPQMFGK